MTNRRLIILATLALLSLAALCAPASAARDDDDVSVWEENRREYLAKREEHMQKRREFYNRYKKRIGSNKYRQKAREFYGRQEGIYRNEYIDTPYDLPYTDPRDTENK